MGIDKGNVDKIFDPFFTTSLGQGTSGLGLHIVYSTIPELLQGQVKVSSNVGGGTKIELSIPVSVEQNDN